MKLINVNKLKIGDWVVTSPKIKEGKFYFGKITGYQFEEVFEIDFDKNKFLKETNGNLKGEGLCYVLNKKELDWLFKSKITLGVIKGLK